MPRRAGGPLRWEAVAEALPVVEAEIVAIVGVAIELDAVLGEGGDQRFAMQRLVVDEDAVEIEENAWSCRKINIGGRVRRREGAKRHPRLTRYPWRL